MRVRRLEDRPIGLVLAARDRLDASVDARLGELLDAVPQGRRDRVELGPMPLAALHRLFLARFGRSFPRLTLVRIEEASAGNPFYALEMARAVIDGGLELGPDGQVPIPERLGEPAAGTPCGAAAGDSIGPGAGGRRRRPIDRSPDGPSSHGCKTRWDRPRTPESRPSTVAACGSRIHSSDRPWSRVRMRPSSSARTRRSRGRRARTRCARATSPAPPWGAIRTSRRRWSWPRRRSATAARRSMPPRSTCGLQR